MQTQYLPTATAIRAKACSCSSPTRPEAFDLPLRGEANPERADAARNRGAILEAAERLFAELQAAGVRVLYDDRDETAGVKFNDADLLGMPWRMTVSPRSLPKSFGA